MQNRTVVMASAGLLLIGGALGWLAGRPSHLTSESTPTPTPKTGPTESAPEPTGGAKVPTPPAAVQLPPPPAGKAVFTATPPDSGTNEAIRLVFDGETYGQPLLVTPIDQAAWDRSTPESSYAGIFSANKAGSIDWMLAAFDAKSQAAVKTAMTEEALANNARIFALVTQETLVERIEYGDYVVLINVSKLENGLNVPSINPMKKTADGWLLTNDLEDDPMLPLLLVLANEKYRSK